MEKDQLMGNTVLQREIIDFYTNIHTLAESKVIALEALHLNHDITMSFSILSVCLMPTLKESQAVQLGSGLPKWRYFSKLMVVQDF